jgi:flavin reductase (DIM6/NTAB) family NADH-FMN oxidoreductase RutF
MKKSVGAKVVSMATPAWVVGSYDAEGRPNAMTVAWGGICCSEPPCVNVSLRKATYSYASILKREAFTVSIPSERYARETDYLGLASGRDADKFSVAGLTPTRAEHVDAPYVEEFPMVLECRLVRHLELGLHTLFVGQVADVKVDEGVIGERGLPEGRRLKPFVCCPEAYYALGGLLGQHHSIGRELGGRNG